MKKICFLMATPFTLGGEQRVVTIISNLLIEKGYDVTILCTDVMAKPNYDIYNLNRRVKIGYIGGYNSKIMQRIREKRWKMYSDNLENGTYKDNLSVQKFINCDPLTKFLLIRSIKTENCDVVISLATIYNTMLARISSKIKAKTIGWQHSCSDLYFDTKGLRHYNQDEYTNYMFDSLDEYVVLTEYEKRYIKNRFGKDVTVINNPKSLESTKVSKLEEKIFLAVGRFTQIKNFTTLIDMFNKFHQLNKEWKLYIVGEGELKDEYLRRVQKYSLEGYVKILDKTDDIEKYYLKASAYLMTSLLEGWGMVMGEALEFGLPIIAFDIPSAPEFIKNKYNGFIVPKYDEEKYVECMLKLASDDNILKEMGMHSKEISSQKSNEKIIEEWEKLFKNK